MKRRGFLTALAAITAASAFKIFGGEPKSPVSELQPPGINPAYLKADYEEVFIWHPRALARAGIEMPLPRAFPRRYEIDGDRYKEVKPFLGLPGDYDPLPNYWEGFTRSVIWKA